MIRLTVIKGPDVGKTAEFQGNRVEIGRGPDNDFRVRDGLVSQRHGVVHFEGGQFLYEDRRSRHGTVIRQRGSTVTLHNRDAEQDVALSDDAYLILGESLLRVQTRNEAEIEAKPRASGGATTRPGDDTSGFGERMATRTAESLDAVTRRLTAQDPRLVSIFKLSRSLNGVTDLDETLELIAETTFDAFPAANFFAISVLDDDGDDESFVRPLLARERDSKNRDGKPLLSRYLLRKVYETQKSFLFVRDAAEINPTESIINAGITACLAAPLVGQRRLLGVMQADTRGHGGLFGPDDLDLFTVLASYTAFAIERVNLTRSIYEMFEGIVKASVTAIDARDPSTAGHSERVAEYTVRLAEFAHRTTGGPLRNITFSRQEMTELRYAALLHDFGKIGVRESVLTKAARFTPEVVRAVCERFESARAHAKKSAFEEALHLGETRQWDIRKVRETADELGRERVAQLNEMLEFVLDSHTRPSLDAAALRRFQEIAKAQFRDSNGNLRNLLTPDELENLLVVSGTLTADEWEDMRSHARRSREFLSQIPWSEDLANIPCFAGWHHEKLDGSGYPDGLVGDQIPVQVRILTIGDIFDALTAADRPYRRAATIEEATRILVEDSEGGLLDRNLVDLFVAELVPELDRERFSQRA